MSFNDNKPFWCEFIELYREQRALWDIKSKNYSNKNIRKEGYSVLVEKCKEVNPDCDEKFVKSKIETLRASFRRELKKVEKSKITGSGQDDVYEPSLWYFDLLLFITDQEVVRKGVSSIGKRSRSIASLEEDEEGVDDVEAETQDEITKAQDDASTGIHADIRPSPSSTPVSRPSVSSRSNPGSTTRTNRKKISDFEKKQERFLDTATSVLCNQNKFRAFGNNVGFQLEDMDRQQQVIAEKLISDVLFHGKLGSLKASAAILTEQQPTQRNIPSLNHFMDTNQNNNPYPYRPADAEYFLQDQNYQHQTFSFDPYYVQSQINPTQHQVQRQHLQQQVQQKHVQQQKVDISPQTVRCPKNFSLPEPAQSQTAATKPTAGQALAIQEKTAQQEVRNELKQYLNLPGVSEDNV
ncbi:uncharacterized protein LOC124371743 [Homalodisca vitripennis]|uniref:uncharacterized protein LOC124371743 n=1 Tax=Homalodisca vitripennis TaxID=197043 RepID=UPI001EEB20A4|nr:uncharacterized protein LOC124371743 [Homalodisca vitripennis]KAG8243233.1 hypothetical protein J6590_049398 [Homalodisca vitripennis]KAG8290097.1 hypothetical protein J6590_090327 [Homalodisca vitripennis]